MSGQRNVLMTGATAGIGRTAALHLAKAGYRVFATGRSEEALTRLRGEAGGTRLETLRLDVTDPASIASAREEILRRTGGHGVDVLVNNAEELVRAEEIRRRFDKNSASPETVAGAMEKAISARRPKARYVAPFSARIMLLVISLLPTRLSDALLRALMGIPQSAHAQGAPSQRLPATGS
jgi:NAD(P)-dependent dehydrogenase (short-subunit alcohol dehydrogenase family)